MDNWEKLSKEIEIETRHYFRDKQVDISDLVELLQKVLKARIDEEYKLGGVAVNIPKAMHDILDDDTTRKEQILNFAILIKFEPFLRKLLFLLEPQKLREITDEKRGLAFINFKFEHMRLVKEVWQKRREENVAKKKVNKPV